MILEGARALVRRVLLLVWFGLIVAAPAAAQKPTFDIEGVVTDAQQAVLPGATVTLQSAATGLSREIATDANGRYVFTADSRAWCRAFFLPHALRARYAIPCIATRRRFPPCCIDVTPCCAWARPTGARCRDCWPSSGSTCA